MKTVKHDDRIETLNDKYKRHSFNDKPAVEYNDGIKYWYKEDKLHRLDGPAIEYDHGSEEWYKEGERHRLDGPACKYIDGTKFWYKEGKCHRLDGPACEYNDGAKYWYYEGKEIECKSTKEFLRIINMKAFW